MRTGGAVLVGGGVAVISVLGSAGRGDVVEGVHLHAALAARGDVVAIDELLSGDLKEGARGHVVVVGGNIAGGLGPARTA